jgi:uncharacterized protein (TIGR02266 family)
MPERRSGFRAVAKIEVYDREARAERVPLYVSGNVSAGGIFLITQSPFARGTTMKISFTLPGESEPIQTVGTVVWNRGSRGGPAQQPGMGAQFDEIREQDRERIRRFVHAQNEVDEIKAKK